MPTYWLHPKLEISSFVTKYGNSSLTNMECFMGQRVCHVPCTPTKILISVQSMDSLLYMYIPEHK